MSIELIRDLLKIDQVIGKDQTQALVEGEITLPDNKPNINKILTIDGDIKVTETKIGSGRIKVIGEVNFKVLYTAEDESQPIHSLNAATDFEEEIEIEGIEEEMIGDVKATIEHIDYQVVEGTRISVKTVIGIEGKAETAHSIDIVKDVRGTEGLQVLKDTIKYYDVIGLNVSTTIVKEAFEVKEAMPDLLDILRVDAKAYERERNIVDDRVIVAGIVECNVMYYGDDEDNKINYLKYDIPFTHFVEITGATKEMMCDVKLHENEVTYEAREDINGDMRIIDIEALVDIQAKVYQQKEKEVTVDTYSTTKKFNVKKQAIDITETIGKKTTREVISSTIEASDPIESVYNMNVKPVVTDYRMIEGKVIIEGILDADMLYIGESSQIKNLRQEIPFKSYVDIEGIEEGMDSQIEIILENVKYNLVGAQKVNVECIVKSDVAINRVKRINIVTEAEELPEVVDKSKRASITIYIVQEKDTIWDIAKRYNTTVEELVTTNDIVNPDHIMPGEKIIIEKVIEFKL